MQPTRTVVHSSHTQTHTHTHTLTQTHTHSNTKKPHQRHDFVEPVRGFARITLRDEEAGAVVCSFRGNDCVYVITPGARFFRYVVPAEGGLCKLAAEHVLLQKPSEEMGVNRMLSGSSAAAGLGD